MKNNYSVHTVSLTENPAFSEASREELRVLLTLISLEGAPADASDIARMSGVSGARCRAAIAFWEEAGVIASAPHSGIVEEFEERLLAGEIDEEPSVTVAATIRNEGLALLIEECAVIMGTPTLSQGEVKNLTALYSQYNLSPEYIVTLAAHLQGKGELTVRQLCNRAIALDKRGVCTPEQLEEYINNAETGYEYEYRRIFGIYTTPSKSQREYFKKWAEEFGYSAAIVTEAYDIAMLNTQKADMRYIDAVLSGWHEAGCRTVGECLAHTEAGKLERQKTQTKKTQKSKPEAPRYGNFDVNEAFLNAVERSFGEKDED